MMLNYRKYRLNIFYLMFSVNALIYGLVYFFPKTHEGEPSIPTYLKLSLDLLILISYFIYGLSKKINQPQVIFLFYLISILTIGIIHIPNIGLKDFLHFSFRNVFFYGVILFVEFFKNRNFNFEKFHEKIFSFVLYFGFTLFTFRVLGIDNPFSFGTWLWEKNRLISTFLNPNSLGFYMMFYLFYFYYKYNKISVISFLIIGTIFLSGSLTAILGVFFFIGFLFLKIFLNIKFQVKYFIILLLITPFILYIFIYFGIFEYVLFKIDILFFKKSKIHTSVSARIQNIYNLIDYVSFSNFFSILFGDFSSKKYVRLDSQYLNIFYNYGVMVLLIFISFLISLQNFFKKNRKIVLAKTFYLFNIWLFFFGFNLTAYIYRVNIIVFYFVMMSFTFHETKKVIKINATK